MKNSLPVTWMESDIGSCFVEITNGTTINQNKDGKGLPVTRIETIQNSRFETKRIQHIDESLLTKEQIEKYRYKVGDIAFSHINSLEHVGKTAIYDGTPETFIHGMNLLRLRLGHSYINPKFAYYQMQSNSFREEVRKRVGRAVNQVSINQKNLSAVPFIIAPFDEQCRIVEKLDALLAKVNNSKARLDRIPAILKSFRQSVLAAAVSGELTKEWRIDKDNLEKAEEVIEQIRNRRLNNSISVSKKQEVKEIFEHVEVGNHFDLPYEWKFISLDKICNSFQYGSSQKSDITGNVPVLRMGNLQNGKVDWSDLKYSSDENEIKKYLLKINDVLFNRTNSPELVGKTSIYKGEQKAIFAGYLIRINCLTELLPDYLNYCLNTPYAKEWCQFAKTDGVSQSNINAQKLSKFEIPFCSFEEQQEIIRKVEELFHFADSIEERYQKAKVWFDKIPQAILAKAFRGELVEQDENDEPASVLLERIKQGKEPAATNSKKPTTRNRAKAVKV